MDEPIDANGAENGTAPVAAERRGFLPMATNWFDRLFVGIYLFVALELLWMRFLEQALPLTICHVLAVALGVLIVWKG